MDYSFHKNKKQLFNRKIQHQAVTEEKLYEISLA
jgi:hypothetical protein